MNTSARSKVVCEVAGCVNTVDTDSEYCPEHNPVSRQLKSTTCIMDGCTNTADFNDNFLCMVCFQGQKNALRNQNGIFELVIPCNQSGCKNKAANNTMNMCNSCHQEFINNPFQKDYLSNNTSNPFKLPERNLSEVIPSINNNITNNNLQEVKNTTSSSTNSVGGACGYGNVIPTKRTIKKRMSCMFIGCNRTIACDSAYCAIHDKQYPSTVCIVKGCTNTAEFNDGCLCMVCLQTQKKASKEIECKRVINPVLSCHIDESPPTVRFSRLVADKSTGPGQSGNTSFDFRAIAKTLPPIPPMPTSLTTPCIQERINSKKENEDTGPFQVVARGTLGREIVSDDLPPIPIPFSSLPPIPMPFKRSNSTPDTSNSQFNQQLNIHAFTAHSPSLPTSPGPVPICKGLNCIFPGGEGLRGYCSDCFIVLNIADSISNTSAVDSTLPEKKRKDIFSKLPCDKYFEECNSSRPPKQICKVVDCKFFVNEGLDGYCSECFMCFNISDNIPPSPTRRFPFDMLGMEEEYVGANRFESQLCKGGNCEFFGNDEFDGYCSGCYKQESLRKNLDVDFIIKDDDDKMCIICIQSVYNTVLLPCGHLYLCFECATTIKNKGNKCPACRSPIKSVHRVYTPD